MRYLLAFLLPIQLAATQATIYFPPSNSWGKTISRECEVHGRMTEKDDWVVIFMDGHYYDLIFVGHAEWCPND